MGTLLTLLGTLLGSASEKNERLAKEDYQDTLDAWQRERERIDELNRKRRESVQRRRQMASAINAPGGIMPAEQTPLSAAGEKPEYETPEDVENLSKWAKYLGYAGGFIDSIPEGGDILGGVAQETEGIPLVGSATRSLAGRYSTEPRTADLGAVTPVQPTGYEYRQRYNPREYLTR